MTQYQQELIEEAIHHTEFLCIKDHDETTPCPACLAIRSLYEVKATAAQ